MKFKPVAALGVLAAVAIAASATAQTFQYVVIANGEKVGHLTAKLQGRQTTVDYAVSNNGRGPKAKEQIYLDSTGLPVAWTIEGESLFGAPVHEHFTWKDGAAQWVSQADNGAVTTAKPMPYIGNDASPWMIGLYVKALLKAPSHTLEVLPSGRLRLTELRKFSLGEGSGAIRLTAYELSGIDLNPEIVLVDSKGDLFADGELIREGYEAQLPNLVVLNREFALQRAEDAQKKLAHHFVGPVRIRNVRIFDPVSQKLGVLSDVVVDHDRIATVTPTGTYPTTKDETVVDGQGGSLVPGLADMHHHITLSSNLYNLAVGVTTVRDMGNSNSELLKMTQDIDAGRIAGVRIVRDGFLEGRSPYSARNGFIADTLPQAIDDVHWYADHGYYEMKLYNSFPADWVAPVAAEAHKLGLGVTGHVPAFSTPDRVIRDGYNSIAHINQLMLGWILDPKEDTRTPLRLTAMARAKDLDLNSARIQETVGLMNSHHVSLDTTTITLERLMLSRSGQVQAGDAAYLSHVPIGYQRYRKRSFVTTTSPADDTAYRLSYQKILETMKMLDAEGIQLLPGTDDTTGFAQLRELEDYVAAGIPAGKTLYLDTLAAQRYLKRDADLGSIERGKLADFVLVEGDPTQNISAMRKARMTMKGGVAYYPAEVFDFLAIKPFAPPPPVTEPVAAVAQK
jgi:imidazolonepropionase-like amidohydrolase